jgi:hypothetical protein
MFPGFDGKIALSCCMKMLLETPGRWPAQQLHLEMTPLTNSIVERTRQNNSLLSARVMVTSVWFLFHKTNIRRCWPFKIHEALNLILGKQRRIVFLIYSSYYNHVQQIMATVFYNKQHTPYCFHPLFNYVRNCICCSETCDLTLRIIFIYSFISFPLSRDKGFFPLASVSSEAHPASYPMGTKGPFSGGHDWFIHYDGARLCLWTAATNGPIVHPAGDVWAWESHGDDDIGWG